MNEKTCYYCGTKYPTEELCCPVCGQTEIVAEEIDEVPADLKPTAYPKKTEEKTVAAPRKRRNRKKNFFATLLCILLALAVVASALWILQSIGILSFRPAPSDESSLELPVEVSTEPSTPSVSGISAVPKSMRFTAVGQKNRLQAAFVSEEDSTVDSTRAVTFVSADPTIAVVSEDGEVTALSDGQTTISLQYENFTAECSVICEFAESTPDAPETSENAPDALDDAFSLSKSDFTLFSAGEKAKISAQNIPEGAAIAWSSKNESVATVSDGVVTAVAPGVTTVTASYAGQTQSCIVRCRFDAGAQPIVTQTADGVSLSHEDVTLKAFDETFKIYLLDGDNALSGVSWSTTNAAVCSVDSDGTVRAVGSGTAKIIGTRNGSSYSCIVRCNF